MSNYKLILKNGKEFDLTNVQYHGIKKLLRENPPDFLDLDYALISTSSISCVIEEGRRTKLKKITDLPDLDKEWERRSMQESS